MLKFVTPSVKHAMLCRNQNLGHSIVKTAHEIHCYLLLTAECRLCRTVECNIVALARAKGTSLRRLRLLEPNSANCAYFFVAPSPLFSVYNTHSWMEQCGMAMGLSLSPSLLFCIAHENPQSHIDVFRICVAILGGRTAAKAVTIVTSPVVGWKALSFTVRQRSHDTTFTLSASAMVTNCTI